MMDCERIEKEIIELKEQIVTINTSIAQLTESIESIVKRNNQTVTENTERLITTFVLHHATFRQYKNIYRGKSLAIVGAGPSLNSYNGIQEDIIYIGLNRAFLKKEIIFDYLFAIDFYGISFCLEDFFEYPCEKFIGDQNNGKKWQIPESYLTRADIHRYKTTAGYMRSRFALDIESQPIGNFLTVSLQAMQFALYTNPKRIYLIGIDCTAASGGDILVQMIELWIQWIEMNVLKVLMK